MTRKTLTDADLTQFTGTEHWYRHGLVRHVLYTDGVKYVADTGGAYWLIDEIALAQEFDDRLAAKPFQVWTLAVKENSSAVLVCDDGNLHPLAMKQIRYTDFPMREIRFYFVDNTILLPSEY
jgi:hypothetical protein